MASSSGWQRPPTLSRSTAPPAHALRCANPHTLFFDFRAHANFTPLDVVRIFSDTSLAYHEDVIGIRFIPTYRLAQVTFRGTDAVTYHLNESGSADADVRCWPALDPDRPLRTIWLRGTPICEPELLDGWVREALEAALPIQDGWQVLDIRLQYFPDTDILTDSVAVSILLPATPATQFSVNDASVFMENTLPREITIGGVPGIQVTWNGATPYCTRCKSIGHSQRACRLSHQPHDASVSVYSEGSRMDASFTHDGALEATHQRAHRRRRGRRGGTRSRSTTTNASSIRPSHEQQLEQQLLHDHHVNPMHAMDVKEPSDHVPVSEVGSSLQLPASMMGGNMLDDDHDTTSHVAVIPLNHHHSPTPLTAMGLDAKGHPDTLPAATTHAPRVEASFADQSYVTPSHGVDPSHLVDVLPTSTASIHTVAVSVPDHNSSDPTMALLPLALKLHGHDMDGSEMRVEDVAVAPSN